MIDEPLIRLCWAAAWGTASVTLSCRGRRPPRTQWTAVLSPWSATRTSYRPGGRRGILRWVPPVRWLPSSTSWHLKRFERCNYFAARRDSFRHRVELVNCIVKCFTEEPLWSCIWYECTLVARDKEREFDWYFICDQRFFIQRSEMGSVVGSTGFIRNNNASSACITFLSNKVVEHELMFHSIRL